MRKLTAQEKLDRHVRKSENGCWPWLGSRTDQGYGRLRVNGKALLPHRVVWELTHGEIPPGKIVIHKCDNPSCCRPDHLKLATQKENMQDASRKGRMRRVKSKLSKKAVLEIVSLRRQGVPTRIVAPMFNVRPRVVRNIMRGDSFPEVTGITPKSKGKIQ